MVTGSLPAWLNTKTLEPVPYIQQPLQTDPIAIEPIDNKRRIRDVIYTKRDGVALTMDIFKPENPNGAAIIKIISGGWKSNHKDIIEGEWSKHGYTTFVVVHGSEPRFTVGEIVTDLQQAVRYIRTNAALYNIHPDKIGITGWSSGAHLSLMLAVKGTEGSISADTSVKIISSKVNAVACFSPPVDLLNWKNDNDYKHNQGPLHTYASAFGTQCNNISGKGVIGYELSPMTWVHSRQPPIYIVHGGADGAVPSSQTVKFFNKSIRAGARCEVVIRKGAKHGGWPEWSQDVLRMIDWFNVHLLKIKVNVPFTYKLQYIESSV